MEISELEQILDTKQGVQLVRTLLYQKGFLCIYKDCLYQVANCEKCLKEANDLTGRKLSQNSLRNYRFKELT